MAKKTPSIEDIVRRSLTLAREILNTPNIETEHSQRTNTSAGYEAIVNDYNNFVRKGVLGRNREAIDSFYKKYSPRRIAVVNEVDTLKGREQPIMKEDGAGSLMAIPTNDSTYVGVPSIGKTITRYDLDPNFKSSVALAFDFDESISRGGYAFVANPAILKKSSEAEFEVEKKGRLKLANGS